jgi:selenide,water dikinase
MGLPPMAILGMPLAKLPVDTVRSILEGGESICREAGIPVAGGHSIDSVEPIYGLAVVGLAAPRNLRRNSEAIAGDALILTKGIGVGIYSAAFKKQALAPEAYAEMLQSTTLLNRVGHKLAEDPRVHAMTDVTGFGLLGHSLEVARGSRVRITIEEHRIPFLRQAQQLAQAGFITGASSRNWASYGNEVDLPRDLPEWRKALLTDPQTSGGLLVACEPDAAAELQTLIQSEGYPMTRIIGRISEGDAGVRVTHGAPRDLGVEPCR